MNENIKNGIGDRFQQETKYSPETQKGGRINRLEQPDLYKTYPTKEKVLLPKARLELTVNFNDLLQNRKSIRQFTDNSITLDDLSYLLWACTGIQRIEHNYEFRTAPSAGALYPIETYLVVNRIDGIEPGIYHYSIKTNELEMLERGNFGKKISEAALGQRMCERSAVVFVFSAVFQRSKWKYKQRAYRYIYMDVGHMVENLALAVTALELGGCPIAAIFDDLVNDLIKLDGKEESAIYLMPIGCR